MTTTPFYVIGNWKSNKTVAQVREWVVGFEKFWHELQPDAAGVKVILCPSLVHLVPLAQLLKQSGLPIALGCQDISAYPAGAYTGEVNAMQVADLVTYVLIGHSERRRFFHESESLLLEKIKQARAAKLKIIYCIQEPTQSIPEGCDFVAYEPVWAIGTGKPETPENADQVAIAIKAQSSPSTPVIYGGSVTADNVNAYAMATHLDGVLPGGASLDPEKFVRLIANASTR